jgi:hypothetical protein
MSRDSNQKGYGTDWAARLCANPKRWRGKVGARCDHFAPCVGKSFTSRSVPCMPPTPAAYEQGAVYFVILYPVVKLLIMSYNLSA